MYCFWFFLIGLFHLSLCQYVPRDYGFCSQIHQMNQYCAENPGLTGQPAHSSPVRRGKAGPIGPPGPAGESAVIDYDAIIARVDEAIAKKHAAIDEKLSMCETKLDQYAYDMQRWKTVEDCGTATPRLAKVWNGTGGVFDSRYGSDEVKEVYCDLATDGGRWLVFQRRMDGSVDFYRNWSEYETGFGNVAGEFWLGLRMLHEIISGGKYELRIDLEDWDGNKRHAKYSVFNIDNANAYYAITAGDYSGDAGDSLLLGDNGVRFSTKDREFDSHEVDNCAVRYKGAWWYTNCHTSNLNGHYFYGGTHGSFADGMEWKSWKGYHYSMKFTEMKIRPVS